MVLKELGLMLHGVNWVWVLVILFLVYFYIHYMFPSITTQSSAVLAGFLSIALGAGVPKLMAGLMFGLRDLFSVQLLLILLDQQLCFQQQDM